jgi:cytosine/adenosine deaminase-related metal-dependent hydrolase
MPTPILREVLGKKIKDRGGWINCHAHIDRANTITPQTLHLYSSSLQEKWLLNDTLKRTSSVDDYYNRMAVVVENMIDQGVVALGTNIDVDNITEDKVIQAAIRLRNNYKDKIDLIFSNQMHYGVLDKESRKWFDVAAEFVDVIGGLPEADGNEDHKHVDILLKTAKRYGKMVHCHVDQMHTMEQKQTEMLAEKTIEHGMEGKVVAIHSLSLAAKYKTYRHLVYKKMRQAGMMTIACPNAWLDNRRVETRMPWHNSIQPVEELMEFGIPVGLGTDGIADIYTPFVDGDMWAEIKTLTHACRISDLDKLADIATTNGRKILGLPEFKNPNIQTISEGNITLKIKNKQKVQS